MDTASNDRKPSDNMELLKEQAAACGPGCDCHAAGRSNRMRLIVGTIVLVAAAALVARAMTNGHTTPPEKAAPGFAAAPTAGQTTALESDSATSPGEPAKTSETNVGEKIGALADLNTVAASSNAVFVFLPAKSGASGKTPSAQIQGAARTIESQGYKVGIFTLKTDSRDYDLLAAQMSVPGVLAMVKGRGMSAVSGDITEPKLIQGFVAASSAGGCGAGGCGPTGCN
ncbi:MAG: hypothetical protein NTW86_06855 [Candidatus Sumerlaeota bacterium]|nr:hypothetical protein [Candidatus Sumerlaeota bacterium]